MKKIIFIGVILCLSISVALAQDIQRPKITSLSVKEALKFAYKNHLSIEISKFAVKAEEGKYLQSISLPPLNVSVVNDFIPNGKSLSNFDERSIEISQSFDFPSIYFFRASKSNAEINAQKSANSQELLRIKKNILRAYFNTLSQRNIIKIAEENFSIADDFNKKAEIRFKNGEISNLEYLTAKAQLHTAKTSLSSAQTEYMNVINQLHYDLGDNYEQIDEANVALSDSLSSEAFNISLDELIKKALETNPLIKNSEYLAESANISKSLAWSSLAPSFSISYSFQSNSLSSNYHGINFGASLPIWFMFSQKGQIEESDAKYQMNLLDLQRNKNSLITTIKNDYHNFKNNETQLKLYQKEILQNASEILRIASVSYQAGEINYLEFLQAKLTAISSKSSYEKALLDYNISIINLEESTGLSIVNNWNYDENK